MLRKTFRRQVSQVIFLRNPSDLEDNLSQISIKYPDFKNTSECLQKMTKTQRRTLTKHGATLLLFNQEILTRGNDIPKVMEPEFLPYQWVTQTINLPESDYLFDRVGLQIATFNSRSLRNLFKKGGVDAFLRRRFDVIVWTEVQSCRQASEKHGIPETHGSFSLLWLGCL